MHEEPSARGEEERGPRESPASGEAAQRPRESPASGEAARRPQESASGAYESSVARARPGRPSDAPAEGPTAGAAAGGGRPDKAAPASASSSERVELDRSTDEGYAPSVEGASASPGRAPEPDEAARATRRADEEATSEALSGLPASPTLKERLRTATLPALQSRRSRIEARLLEIARPIGESALALERIRATKLVDLDRILKKLDRVDDELHELGRDERARPEGLLDALTSDLGRLSARLSAREVKAKRARLVTELGLAVLAADLGALRGRAPAVAALVQSHVAEAREVDQLFFQSRLVDEELEDRDRDGRLYREPKAIEAILGRTGEVVGDATDLATDKLKDLGKSAARAAVKGTGKAVLGLAKGALHMGKDRILGDEDDDAEDDDRAARRRARKRSSSRSASSLAAAGGVGPTPREVPDLLRELARLHKDGVLTDEEFARKKADLLGRL